MSIEFFATVWMKGGLSWVNKELHLILTCEHGDCRIPQRYRSLFAGCDALLASHRGFDLGALPLLRRMARATGAPYFTQTVSRLLVDANRREQNPSIFSEFTRILPGEDRERILARYYRPYRDRVAAAMESKIAKHRCVLHISVHSFTPVLAGRVRHAEIGLLYDPARTQERDFCRRWKTALRRVAPDWRVHMNYPYKGTADGFTTALRRRFPESHYIGIELEVNQALYFASRSSWRKTCDLLVLSLQSAIAEECEGIAERASSKCQNVN